MANVSGQLSLVTGDPDLVVSIGVASERVRPGKGGVITARPKVYKIDGGKVSFPCEPGKAVITLHYLNNAVDTIPILVGEKSSYTLKEVVEAGELADGATQRELEVLAADIKSLISSSASDRSAAAVSAREAKSSASDARSSAADAKRSERAAAGSAASAAATAGSVSAAAAQATSSASQAATSEGAAALSARGASESAAAAARSESSAKSEADRASRIASSTSWSGDKLTVNGKTSPPLTGPKGDRGPKGQDGEVTFEALTTAQRESLRGPAGVVVSTSEPSDKDVVWVDPSGANLDLLSNAFYVNTDAEATALSGKVSKGTYVIAAQSGNVYKEE